MTTTRIGEQAPSDVIRTALHDLRERLERPAPDGLRYLVSVSRDGLDVLTLLVDAAIARSEKDR